MTTTLFSVCPSTQLRVDTSRPSAGVARVALTGEIDLATMDALGTALSEVLSEQLPHRMEVDFSGVRFLDCTGVTVLVRARHAALRLGCQFRISGVQPAAGRLLELLGLLEVLTAPLPMEPAQRR